MRSLQLLHSPVLLLPREIPGVRKMLESSSVEGLEGGSFPPLRNQPQIILCSRPQKSPQVFLFVWTRFLSQPRERDPDFFPCSERAVEGP